MAPLTNATPVFSTLWLALVAEVQGGLCHCPGVWCIRLCIRVFICFFENTHQILMKFHRNYPAMVLLRICWKNLIPSKIVVAIATKVSKLKNIGNLLKSSCLKLQGLGPHSFNVVGLYQDCLQIIAQTVTTFTWAYKERTLEIFLYLAMRPRVTKFCMWLYL